MMGVRLQMRTGVVETSLPYLVRFTDVDQKEKKEDRFEKSIASRTGGRERLIKI